MNAGRSAPPLDLDAELRLGDPERWLILRFAPHRARSALVALHVLNLELARVPDRVEEPLAGELRLNWWSDAVCAALAGRPERHPVLERLAGLAASGTVLSFEEVSPVIEARRTLLGDGFPTDLESLVAHARATSGRLNRLSLILIAEMADGREGANAGSRLQAAEDLGTAYGLLRILHGMRIEAAQGRVLLPAGMRGRVRVRARSLTKGEWPDELRAPVRAIVGRAKSLAQGALGDAGRVPLRLRAPFLLSAPLAHGIAALERADHDPLRADLALSPRRLLAGLWWRMLTGVRG